MLRPHAGLEIDGFRLTECLHRGGFATIWAVTHPLYRTPMVMKVPTILDGYDAPTIVGFEVEQMIMPRLTGPHVLRVIAEGDFTVMPYIVTEMIPGPSLLELFSKAPRPLSEVIEITVLMTEAVHDLHKQHVIHLDLKPDNFMRRPTGEMVCIDFGLSRHDGLPDLLAEEFTIPMGTFPYIAPEQYLGQRNDLRSDVFALGVMIYELTTGKMPFGKPERLRGVRRRLWSDPVPPRAIDRMIPEWLQEIILRGLEVDPKDRYQTAAQMLFDLQNPQLVKLTDRAHRMERDGFWTRVGRWRRMRKLRRFPDPPSPSAQIQKAPILMVAVDLASGMEDLARQILHSLKRMLELQPDARVACVNVIRSNRIGVDHITDEKGEHLHVARLISLRKWARELDMPEDRLTFTILEHTDPAKAIIDYAAKNHVSHILMGARSHSLSRRILGSVSSQVVAEAPCSATVIRVPLARRDEPAAPLPDTAGAAPLRPSVAE
ncbi:protein kinase [Cereibacter sphaeroides]|uniref:serine/threonine protein kinase n=1 Tax=Cereibacter sphaeroides TaxID=1063 RepID=UPI001F211236|nr:bifunctional serine/threonine-protein kinase/universal stress protein [Cereibacter sphaeroides]MCE6951275.1 protein kinase [Cereibacter sphaeroides]